MNILKIIRPNSNAVIIDALCGNGETSNTIASKTNMLVKGYDLSDSSLQV